MAMAHAFDVHGDPGRRRIHELLAPDEPAPGEVVAVIHDEFGISPPAVSPHRRTLRETGFASVRPAGARRLYSLEPTAIDEVDQWVGQVRAFWDQRLDALATELARGKRARRTAATRPAP
jgi:DNA-binding transcriptional ArsR family regulator